MAIPDYQRLMLPLLRLASDGREHRFRDAVESLAAEFQITDEERAVLLPSGTQPVFDNRVGWARTYLKQAGLLNSTKRGMFQITEAGRLLVAESPHQIDIDLLDRYPLFREFRSRRRDKPEIDAESETRLLRQESGPDRTPEEALAVAYQKPELSVVKVFRTVAVVASHMLHQSHRHL